MFRAIHERPVKGLFLDKWPHKAVRAYRFETVAWVAYPTVLTFHTVWRSSRLPGTPPSSIQALSARQPLNAAFGVTMQEPRVNAIAAVARERGGQFNDAFTATSHLVAEYGERRSDASHMSRIWRSESRRDGELLHRLH